MVPWTTGGCRDVGGFGGGLRAVGASFRLGLGAFRIWTFGDWDSAGLLCQGIAGFVGSGCSGKLEHGCLPSKMTQIKVLIAAGDVLRITAWWRSVLWLVGSLIGVPDFLKFPI